MFPLWNYLFTFRFFMHLLPGEVCEDLVVCDGAALVGVQPVRQHILRVQQQLLLSNINPLVSRS